jgi:ABC-type Fe3+ transport system permease subunit
MTNVSIAIFLVTPSTQVATFSILGLIGDNRFEAASVLTTALLALTLVIVAATWRLSRGAHLASEVVSG